MSIHDIRIHGSAIPSVHLGRHNAENVLRCFPVSVMQNVLYSGCWMGARGERGGGEKKRGARNYSVKQHGK